MWEAEGIERFDPERWLKKDAEGKPYCDRDAGPANAFGSGPRACFGKINVHVDEGRKFR